MSESDEAQARLNVAVTAALVFLVGVVGCTAGFALWLRDLDTPQVDVLGAGNRLSLLVTDGPARLLIATGDDPDQFDNALARFRPIFARRVDVLLIAGANRTLNVPLAAHEDAYVRESFALAPLPRSPEADAFGPLSTFPDTQVITLGPNVTVTVETAYPLGADPNEVFPAWRATITRAESRIVVVSDGDAAALFPPGGMASVLVVAGNDPTDAWDAQPALALVANSDAISGPELRAVYTGASRSPDWTARVFPGEALRLHFVEGGVEISSEAARRVEGTPVALALTPRPAVVAPHPQPFSPRSGEKGAWLEAGLFPAPPLPAPTGRVPSGWRAGGEGERWRPRRLAKPALSTITPRRESGELWWGAMRREWIWPD